MPAPLISDAFVWRLSVWRLSVAYIGSKSRTERPRKTKIGTEVAHVTRDSDTTFKVKRSKVKVTRPLSHQHLNASGSCSGEHGNVLGVGNYCYVAVCSLALGASAPTGEERGGVYHGGRPPTACFPPVHVCVWICSAKAMEDKLRYAAYNCIAIDTDTSPARSDDDY